MARVVKFKRSPDAISYTSDQWLVFGTNPQPSTREKMILLAIEEIIETGPGDFNATVVCDRLGIAYPMINHNFGDRDGLIAEAIMATHDSWSKGVEAAFKLAPADPMKRLRKFIEHEIAWSVKMQGMGVLMHYPTVSSRVSKAVMEKFGDRMRRNFEFHLALITVTILDIRAKTVSDLEFGKEDFPRTQLVIAHPAAFTAAVSISWATHGLAMWSGGDHVATNSLAKDSLAGLTASFVVNQHIKHIIGIAKKS
jgi:AcrR family transcriptional regulator